MADAEEEHQSRGRNPQRRGPNARTPSGARYPHCTVCNEPKLGHQRTGCKHLDGESSPEQEPSEPEQTPPPHPASARARARSAPLAKRAAAASTGWVKASRERSTVKVAKREIYYPPPNLHIVKEEPESASRVRAHGSHDTQKLSSLTPLEVHKQLAVIADLEAILDACALKLANFNSIDETTWEIVISGNSDCMQGWVASLTAKNKDPNPAPATPSEAPRPLGSRASATFWWILVLLLGVLCGIAIPITVVLYSA